MKTETFSAISPRASTRARRVKTLLLGPVVDAYVFVVEVVELLLEPTGELHVGVARLGRGMAASAVKKTLRPRIPRASPRIGAPSSRSGRLCPGDGG